MEQQFFRFSAEVETALARKRPIVALESTVIAHGLPHPQNIETAQRLEEIVRETGAVPATIALLDGHFCVGLNQAEIRLIAEENDIKKISIRDLPVAIAKRWNGATTVASTSWIAERAGISVFATGGIGGVHRGSLPDISADLPTLAATPIVVVCSGAKIVLDLPATREWLETNGITVVGYQCDEMPAFYSRRSGLPVDMRAESADEVAEVFRAQQRLGVRQALLVTVPVPEEFEVPAQTLAGALDSVLAQAARENISGRQLTPFLLSQMAQHTEGTTLSANLALLQNNARVSAEIAVAVAADAA
jgi:pseudouridine-5'-phosphate glycosidase